MHHRDGAQQHKPGAGAVEKLTEYISEMVLTELYDKCSLCFELNFPS